MIRGYINKNERWLVGIEPLKVDIFLGKGRMLAMQFFRFLVKFSSKRRDSIFFRVQIFPIFLKIHRFWNFTGIEWIIKIHILLTIQWQMLF